MWSLGITLLETIQGSIPYVSDSIKLTSEKVFLVQRIITQLDTIDLIQRVCKSFYSENWLDFIKKCLNPLDNRPKLKQLCETKFYEESNKSFDVRIIKDFIREYFTNENETISFKKQCIKKSAVCIAESTSTKSGENKPEDAVQLEISCPNVNCGKEAHFWFCKNCYRCYYYYNEFFYCACGKAPAYTFEFKCSDPTHGNDFYK